MYTLYISRWLNEFFLIYTGMLRDANRQRNLAKSRFYSLNFAKEVNGKS